MPAVSDKNHGSSQPAAQGVPSFLHFPQFAFLLRPCLQWERARIVHSPGPGLSCHLVSPTSCTHTHTHTQRAWAPGPRTRWVGAHLLPEPLSMLDGAAGMGHVGTRGTRWYGVNSLSPFGPHVVVCVQGQMGVFTTQHFHNPVCFHLTFAQVKWEGCLPLLLLLQESGLILQRSGSPQEAKASGRN